MSEQRNLVEPTQDTRLFRSLSEDSRAANILRLTAPANLRALLAIGMTVFLLGVAAVGLVVAQRNYDRSAANVEILARLLANEVQQELDTTSPALIDMARIGANALVTDPLPGSIVRDRRQLTDILSSTKAVAVAIIDATGRIRLETGSMAMAPFVPSIAELQKTDERAAPGSVIRFHPPVTATASTGSSYFLPLSLSLANPVLGNAYAGSGGYLIVLLPEHSLSQTLTAYLPNPARFAAFVIEPTGKVLVSTRKDTAADLPLPGEQFAASELQGTGSSFLDQDVSVFSASISDRRARGLGSEWVGAYAAIPGQVLDVMVLDATDPLTLVLSESALLVLLALVPAIVAIGLFSYIVINTWMSQDQRVRDLQNWVSRYRVATNLLRSGLIEWFPNEGKVVLSGSWKSLLGYRDSEIASEIDQWHDRIHPDDHDRVLSRLQELMDASRLRSEQRYQLEDHEGGYITIIERAAVEQWPSGQVRRIILVHSVDDLPVVRIGGTGTKRRPVPAS